MGPNPNKAMPNPNIPGICYIKNTVKNPNIIVGDYTYYFDATGKDNFEDHVTNFYSFSKDKLIIGKFCDIATGVEFVMNAANHRMNCVTTYPFYIMGSGWGNHRCQCCGGKRCSCIFNSSGKSGKNNKEEI